MGLRSPQQLDKVQVDVPNMPQVEAGKTSTIDLATPTTNFMTQKAIGDQIDSVNKIVINRKDSLAKIKSKYAVESVTSEYKSRIAALVGNNAITESQDLLAQATRAIDDLKQKAPTDLADQVGRDSEIKIQELQTLVTDKMAIEGRKSAIDTGNANVKALTMEASSVFLDKENFKSKYNKTYEYSRHTEAIKGGSEDTQIFNSAAVASNSVVEGVKFSLSQVATPDKVERYQKYYNEEILKDPDIHVTTEDQTKINNAFAAAKEKAEGDLGYALAAEAKKRGYDIRAAEDFIFKNANGSTKAATQGYNLFVQEQKADKEEIEKNDRDTFGNVVKAMRSGNPAQAEKLTRSMSPDGELKARKYLNTLEGGTARAYTNPKDREFLSRLDQTNKEALAKEDLDKYHLSREDRRYWEARQRVYGRDTQDKNFAIDSGSLEVKADQMAHNLAKAKLGLKVQTDPKLAAQVAMNARDILYEVRDKYPNEKNEAIIMGYVRDRLNDPDKGVLKGITEPNWIGSLLNKVNIDTSGNSWFNNDKVQARPTHEFKSQDQTGGKGSIRVPEPTAEDISQWQEIAKKKGKEVDEGTAASQIKAFWKQNPARIPKRQ